MTEFAELKEQLQLAIKNRVEEVKEERNHQIAFIATIEALILAKREELNDIIEIAELLQKANIQTPKIERHDTTMEIVKKNNFLILQVKDGRCGLCISKMLDMSESYGFQNFFYEEYADKDIPISLDEKESLIIFFYTNITTFKKLLKIKISETIAKYTVEE